MNGQVGEVVSDKRSVVATATLHSKSMERVCRGSRSRFAPWVHDSLCGARGTPERGCRHCERIQVIQVIEFGYSSGSPRRIDLCDRDVPGCSLSST